MKKECLLKNVNLLNVILLAVVIVSVRAAILPFLSNGVAVPLPSPKIETPVQTVTAASETAPSLIDYLMIAEQNLFHPERKAPTLAQSEKATSRPEIVLYGILMTEHSRIAYIEDRHAPVTTPGRGKRQCVVKEGESVGGFVLSEIGTDRITITRDGERFTIVLQARRQEEKGTAAQALPAQAKGQAAKEEPRSAPLKIEPKMQVYPHSVKGNLAR